MSSRQEGIAEPINRRAGPPAASVSKNCDKVVNVSSNYLIFCISQVRTTSKRTLTQTNTRSRSTSTHLPLEQQAGGRRVAGAGELEDEGAMLEPTPNVLKAPFQARVKQLLQ